jgi:hypothetical protein
MLPAIARCDIFVLLIIITIDIGGFLVQTDQDVTPPSKYFNTRELSVPNERSAILEMSAVDAQQGGDDSRNREEAYEIMHQEDLIEEIVQQENLDEEEPVWNENLMEEEAVQQENLVEEKMVPQEDLIDKEMTCRDGLTDEEMVFIFVWLHAIELAFLTHFP